MAKTKPDTVAATDETTLPLEAQTEAPAPVVEGADIPQIDDAAPVAEGQPQVSGEEPAETASVPAEPVAPEATDVAPEGTPDAEDPVPVVDTAPDADQAPVVDGANVHGIGPDVGGGPNPDYNPDADPLPINDQIADPVVLPDADLLTTLVASIERRNSGLHRPALLGELRALGAAIDGLSITLAGVRAEAVSEDEGLLLTNWCMAARQALAVIADV